MLSKKSPTTAADLLALEKDHGITLADEFHSALAGALKEFTGDQNLAVFAMAEDLLPGLLENFAGLHLDRYITEERL